MTVVASLVVATLSGTAQCAYAAALSGTLSSDEIRKVSSFAVLPSAHRAYTAPAIEGDGQVGLSMGLESTFVFRRDLTDIGDRSGVQPRLLPVPRFWLAWDLPSRFQISGSFAPGGLFDGISAYGAGVQWAFLKREDIATTLSVLLNYTYVDVFSDLNSHVIGVDVQVSRDLDIWQPYAAAGFLVANSTLQPGLEKSGADRGPLTTPAFHMAAGARIDVGAKLFVQADLVDFRPALSAMLSTNF